MKESEIIKSIITDIFEAETDSKLEKCKWLYGRLDTAEFSELCESKRLESEKEIPVNDLI